jgi:Spy/CpxP family protein refolding chaperone
MNRWIARIVTLASLTGAVALVPAGVAYAQQAPATDASPPRGHHGHRMGLIGDALKLDSLTAAQRTSIEQLVQTRRTAEVPVRQADAQLLTVLAQQVDQAAINRQALAPTVSARESAALSAHAVDLDTAQKLHDLLTPAQRGQLIDAVEAHAQAHAGHMDGGPGRGGRHGHLGEIAKKLGLSDQQKQQIASNLKAEHTNGGDAGPRPDFRAAGRAYLEAFRGDTFNASAAAPNAQPMMDRRADRMEDLLVAALPVLSPTQRAELSSHLRARAAHESHG